MRCSEALLCFPFVGHVVWRVRRLFDSGTEVSRACALLPLGNAFLLSRTRVPRVVARASPLGCVAPNSACQSRIGNQILCARIPSSYLNGDGTFSPTRSVLPGHSMYPPTLTPHTRRSYPPTMQRFGSVPYYVVPLSRRLSTSTWLSVRKLVSVGSHQPRLVIAWVRIPLSRFVCGLNPREGKILDSGEDPRREDLLERGEDPRGDEGKTLEEMQGRPASDTGKTR